MILSQDPQKVLTSETTHTHTKLVHAYDIIQDEAEMVLIKTTNNIAVWNHKEVNIAPDDTVFC